MQVTKSELCLQESVKFIHHPNKYQNNPLHFGRNDHFLKNSYLLSLKKSSLLLDFGVISKLLLSFW